MGIPCKLVENSGERWLWSQFGDHVDRAAWLVTLLFSNPNVDGQGEDVEDEMDERDRVIKKKKSVISKEHLAVTWLR